MKKVFFFLSLFLAKEAFSQNNVIFFHPDGMGYKHWMALRWLTKGPDGKIHWDSLEHIALYKGHLLDSLTATSHGGATVHAYGVKAKHDSFGKIEKKSIRSASKFQGTLMQEAQAKGILTGLIQTGHIGEPGTAVFVSSVDNRQHIHKIAETIIRSGVDLIFSGGEKYMLPAGVQGRFGLGTRKDNKNLIKKAKALGYTIVYTREELKKLSPNEKKVLGIFAYDHTFHDKSEKILQVEKLPLYVKTAPTVKEMSSYALAFFKNKKKNFFLVIEEEGVDNFSNVLNTKGFLAAAKRADDALGVLKKFVAKNPHTLVLSAADSNAGAPALLGTVYNFKSQAIFIKKDQAISKETLDNLLEKNKISKKRYNMLKNILKVASGQRRKDGKIYPFLTAKDRYGKQHPFLILRGSFYQDSSGGILVRAMGKNADKVKGLMDNTSLFILMHKTLFSTK